ncbi:ABC transporter permease subunit [Paenibacillus filicis]|uniref:ABC transporter permease subunit n=1 Tax=Paenibacillus gyeongsangnamensis TaxID=3388067 RepID=A0ABT4Q3I8_9BACL|nr:ABC transporter permease subunit [Paenibacillus filicis]MCZ8511270.1 ABC transporter permease subunit [Paenibacillus filicis]
MITIVGMTWKEMLRKKVMLLTLIMSVVFLTAFWFVASALGSNMMAGRGNVPGSTEYLIQQVTAGSVILTLGFFFGAFVMAFLSIFSSFSVIAGEAEQGVLQALLPRPIPRTHWYLGRWLGYVSLGIVYAALLFGSILAITAIRATIPSDATALIKSFLLFVSVVPLLISLSMLGSCYFSGLGNGVFMTMLYGAGWLGGMIEKLAGSLRLEEAIMKPLMLTAGILSILMPADALQRRMLSEMFSLTELQDILNLNSLLGPLGFTQVPSNAFLWFSAGYTLLALALGLLLFRKKDL